MTSSVQVWDLIIVGAGSAGIPCAIAAAEAGAHVVVAEKSHEIGGTLHLSGGHMSGGGTRRQRERGIEDSPDLHFADVMRICHVEADPVLVRLAVDEAPHTLDWLDDLGLPWNPDTPKIVYGHEPYQIPRTVFGMDGGKSILDSLRPEWEKHVASGAICSLLEHEMTELTREQGAVTGIRVRNAEGERELRGRAVVLTTGGYASNPQFFDEVTPGNPKLVSTARETSTGDGIIAARKLGARFQHGDKYIASLGGVELDPGSGRASWDHLWAMVFSPLYRPPREIYVNARGERFVAEDEPNPDIRERLLLQQPDHQFWCIWDERAIDDGSCIIRQWNTTQLRVAAAEEKTFWMADSIEDLARKAGIHAAGLVETVSRWNESTRTGDDPLGRRDLSRPIEAPPFYAMLTHATSLITFGGLAVDGELRVLDEAGRPIPNLYAAGEILGAAALMGQSFCGGMMQTPAISFGRILGRRLATTH